MAQDVHFEIKKRSPLPLIIAVVAVVAIAVGAYYLALNPKSDTVVFGETLKVHFEPTMAGEEHIIKFVSEHIAPDYGIKLEAVGLQDPVQSNRAVADGDYAATIYQHQWWLKQVVDANGFELTSTFPIYQWGFGIYSERYKSIDDLPEGAVIAVPNDGANQGQALWLLERQGLIGLNKQVEPRTAKLRDIAENPRKFEFKELELMTLPRVLDSVDAAIGYISEFDSGKVAREKGILFPQAPRTFASQLVIGTKFLNDPQIKKLQQAFADPRLDEYLKTTDDPLVAGVFTAVSEN
ncbi:metal ABC transporter substrate-binding protein [Campylobacterota bacterium]|nr:metal ABC transporter substrate-binding protein [Campylobacterota bacterium]GHV03452.1 metal ABC transporter substrate-binding protein [Campylobacterota bacterium]